MFSAKSRENFIKSNAKEMAMCGTTSGQLLEKMAAKLMNGTWIPGNLPFDYILPNGKKVEVKSTISPQGKGIGTRLRIQSYLHKKDKFDYIHIIDGFNDKHFFIPHDDWFDFIGTTDMFYWDVDYGTRQKANTEFLLQEKYAIR